VHGGEETPQRPPADFRKPLKDWRTRQDPNLRPPDSWFHSGEIKLVRPALLSQKSRDFSEFLPVSGLAFDRRSLGLWRVVPVMEPWRRSEEEGSSQFRAQQGLQVAWTHGRTPCRSSMPVVTGTSRSAYACGRRIEDPQSATGGEVTAGAPPASTEESANRSVRSEGKIDDVGRRANLQPQA